MEMMYIIAWSDPSDGILSSLDDGFTDVARPTDDGMFYIVGIQCQHSTTSDYTDTIAPLDTNSRIDDSE